MSRRAVAAGSTLLASLVLTGCQPTGLEPPTLRQVAFGFESIVRHGGDWSEQAGRLDAVGANAVSIAVGRPEWTGFAWPGHPGAAAPAVEAAGGDLVAPAIAALGSGREVTLVVDALAPLTLERHPALAGVAADGTASDAFASVAALDGVVGDRLVALVDEVAARYRPDFVAITELLVDGATFGDADLIHYRAATGAADWPRDGTGAIAVDDPRIHAWRSETVAGLVERAAAAAERHGVRLAVDVRADHEDAAAGRPESGHDYARLLAVADRLVVWSFLGEEGLPPAAASGLTADLRAAGVDAARLVVQIGVWGIDDATVGGAELEASLRHASSHGFTQVSVTPASLLDDEDWRAVAAAWR